MPVVSLFERTRTRNLQRVKPQSRGNFLTKIEGFIIFRLEYSPAPENYPTYELYEFPDTHPAGIIFPPPPAFPFMAWRLDKRMWEIIPEPLPAPLPPLPPTPAIIPPPVVVIPPIPKAEAPTPTMERVEADGRTHQIIVDTRAKTIIGIDAKTRVILLLADKGNTKPIFVGYSPTLTIETGFPLEAGAGLEINIDNPRKVFVIAETAGQKLYIEYSFLS